MTIALAVPHTPWIPERARSMAQLRGSLGFTRERDKPDAFATLPGDRMLPNDAGWTHYREFTARAPNNVWCVELWTWLRDTGAAWCLQLQDDVVVMPGFWSVLRAMLGAVPEDVGVVGIAGVHPMATGIARRGHRWYRTPNNLVGWAYALRHEALVAFLDAREQYEPRFREMHEDEQIGEWCHRTRRPIWHPVPAICDHDTTIPSSYRNDHHSHRRPAVTWRTFDSVALAEPSFWMPSGVPNLLATAYQRTCWYCGVEPSKFRSDATGCELGPMCMMRILGAAMGVQVAEGGRGG